MSTNIFDKLLKYDPDTGKLYWKPRPISMFSIERIGKTWNTRFSGKEAFTAINSEGYHYGFVNGKQQKAHRVIWYLVHGEWPEEIDHINGNKKDNSIINLRRADRKINCKNLSLGSTNNSGYYGVGYLKNNKKWRARITVNCIDTHLGLFDSFEEAVKARKNAEIKYGYHVNHGRVLA